MFPAVEVSDLVYLCEPSATKKTPLFATNYHLVMNREATPMSHPLFTTPLEALIFPSSCTTGNKWDIGQWMEVANCILACFGGELAILLRIFVDFQCWLKVAVHNYSA